MANEKSKAQAAAAAKWATFDVPPLAGSEALQKALAQAKRMTPDQVVQSSIQAGIHTAEGKLSKKYGG